MMQDVTAPPEAFFQTIFGEVGKVYAVKWKDVLDSVWHLVDKDENYHNIVYNQDLDQPAIVAGWTTLRDFYQLTEDHLVSLHHYGFVTFKVYLTEQKVSCSSLTKFELICTWRTLQNAGSYSIIGGRHQKLELDENIYARPCRSPLTWK
ncbi:hypothetical protein GmHk_04G010431 [Glycine max]|nr:hypothetical protein GmHk_04G010431 [Glycine max]